jgi:predicted nucleotidyltransferase
LAPLNSTLGVEISLSLIANRVNMKPPLPNRVRHVIAELAADESVREVWLIGSQADGSATAASDWDLLVLSGREPQNRPARHFGIDILWAGPSGKVLLEGQSEFLAFAFTDLQWNEQGDGTAQYLGRKFVERKIGVVYDTSEPVQIRSVAKAVRVARGAGERGSQPSDA